MTRGTKPAKRNIRLEAKLHNQRAKRLVSAQRVYKKQARQQAAKIEKVVDDYQRLHEDSHKIYVIQGRPERARRAYFTSGFAGVGERAGGLLQGEAKLQKRMEELAVRDAKLRKSAGKVLGVKPKERGLEYRPEVLAALTRQRSLKVIQADAQTHREWWVK